MKEYMIMNDFHTNPEHWFRPAPNTNLNDICGMEDLRRELKSRADSLTAPIRSKIIPGTPSALLFYGPPGAGKTFYAQAFARELTDKGYMYMHVNICDLLSCYVGETEKNIDLLFRTAIEHAPCVLVIDDLDEICRNRCSPLLKYHEHSCTNAVLYGYSKMRDSGADLVLIGISSVPWNVDAALTDKMESLCIPFPDDICRAGYLQAQLRMLNPEQEVLDLLTRRTAGSSFRHLRQIAKSIREQVCKQLTDVTDPKSIDPILLCPTLAMAEQALHDNPMKSDANYLRQLEAYR